MSPPPMDLQDLAASETFTFTAHRPDTDAAVTVVCAAPYTEAVQAAAETFFEAARQADLTREQDRTASRAFAAAVLRDLPGITDGGRPLDCREAATVAKLFDTAPWLVGAIVTETMEQFRFLVERSRRSSPTSGTSADSTVA